MDHRIRSRAGTSPGSRTFLALIALIALIASACGGAATSPATSPVASAPAAESPAAESPAAESPAAESPAAESPAAESPAAESPATESAAAESPATAAECPASAQGQTVEMWSPLTGPDGDEMTRLAQQYSSENESGITVEHVAQPEYVQKLEAGAAAKALPALTVVRVTNVGQLAVRNVLKPFSDEVMGIFGEDFASDFPENAWVRGEYNGQRYSVPLDLHPLVMYYNKDMFAAAGLEEPGTEPMSREDFEAALTALQESGVQPISIGTEFQGATLFQSFIVQFGGAIANEEGTEATYNSEAGVQALEYVNQLKQQYSPDVSGTGDPEVQGFKQEKAAIVIHGPWWISDLSTLPFTGYAPIPQVGDQFAVWAGSHQLALTTEDPAAQAAAACWIAWLSDNSVQWAAAGQVPASNAARENEELATAAPGIAAVAPTIDKAVILPQVAGIEGALWDEFGPVVNAILLGETTDIAAGLNEAAGRSQQKLEENAEQFGE